jgi:hypothetical protein
MNTASFPGGIENTTMYQEDEETGFCIDSSTVKSYQVLGKVTPRCP